MYSNNLGIGDLEIGISQKGMEEYITNLKLELLQTSKDKINAFDEVEQAINNGWQGKSRDIFLEKFKIAREKICEDLEKEYQDLENRLTDLQSAYFEADQNLMSE